MSRHAQWPLQASWRAEFQTNHGLFLNPLLSLIVWRLARSAAQNPRINATALAGGVYLYDAVNLGFTVQVGSSLYVVVLRDAASKNEPEFVRELGELQRTAMKHALKPDQTIGATIGLTSMARWNITRHVPILIPQTAVMIAHSATVNGVAYLGASYDHRLLTGFDVAQILQVLALPKSL